MIFEVTAQDELSEVDVAERRNRTESGTEIYSQFRRTALSHPSCLAIVDGDWRFTYEAILLRIDELHGTLLKHGLRAGDRIALILENSAGFVIAALAIWKLRGVVIPLNPSLQDSELLPYVRDSGARMLIVSSARMETASLAAAAGVDRVALYSSATKDWIPQTLVSCVGARVPSSVQTDQGEHAPALMQYSTGSTGAPKRTTRSQSQLSGELRSVAQVLNLSSADCVLGVVPFYHSHGLKNAALLPLLFGASLHVLNTFLPRHVARVIEREGITVLPGVPFMFQKLAELRERHDLSSLRLALCGTAPLARGTAEALERACSIKITRVYGTTETGLITIEQESTRFAGPNLVGKPIPRVVVQIVDDHGQSLSEGKIGRVKVTSPFAASRYDNYEGRGSSYFEEGSYYPGDLGYMTAGGCLVLVGRESGFINVGGNKVDPAEVEAALLALHGVVEAAVLGVPDGASAEKVKAVIVTSSAISEQEIRSQLAKHLAPFKRPRIIEFRKELPRSPLGKILRAGLAGETSDNVSVEGRFKMQTEVEPRYLSPLYPLQEGILFDYLRNETRDTYVLLTFFGLRSRPDTQRLIDALQKVIDRHDILRTTVLWEQMPHPVQVVHPEAKLPVEELPPCDDTDPIEYVTRRIQPHLATWDISCAPMMKLWLVERRADGRWYAALQVHHLICDQASLQIVLAETAAFLCGQGDSLPPAAPFRGFVEEALGHPDPVDAESFLRTKLADIDEPAAPFGLLDMSGEGERLEYKQSLSSALTRQVRIQARQSRLSVSRFVHAAWALVVARTTGRDDVMYGTVVRTRMLRLRSSQRQHVMEPSINTLPLRLKLRDRSVKELLEHTRHELDELLQYESVPLALAKRCSGITGTVPLFTSLLNYFPSKAVPGSESAADSGVEFLGTVTPSTNFPITASLVDFGEHIELRMRTDRRICPKRISGYLLTALGSLVTAAQTAPDMPALALPILPSEEAERVVEGFNATQTQYSQTKVVHELFEEQAARTPDQLSIVYGGKTLTYKELDREADRIASHLKRHGVQADELVAVHVERGPLMVIALLAVLKAGGAYLPLDPHYPPDRLGYMINDAKVRLVLTEDRSRETLPQTNAPSVMLDALLREMPVDIGARNGSAEKKTGPTNLVYVIYTSGSTGRPKGTAMSHRSMVNLIEWHRENLPAAGQRVLQFAALSFDVAFQEVFSTLCTGGTLVLLDEWVRRDVRALAECLNEQAIDRMFLPPLMLQSLAEHLQAGDLPLPPLKDIITAGEQLRVTPNVVDLFKHLHGCRLHNHYGPTETHVVTALTLDGDPEQWPQTPSIGRPIANTQIYVLDGRLQPVPVDVAGEIYIGGANVARGYLDRPELTAERFVQDRFSREPNARLYKTGDLGRWRPDGTLDYVGRNDSQVKIRSFRIELGEVESRLSQHPEVKDAVVIAREDEPGRKHLVAYVTSRAKQSPAIEELCAHLRATLPDHMIPGAFVVLDEFPVTPSGKLDRRSLKAPGLDAYITRPYEPPVGEREEILANVWRELLKVDRVGRQDNFYELGGDSFTAMKLTSTISRQFAVPIGVQAVLRSPRLLELAQVVDELLKDTQPDGQFEELTI